ncbi:sigma-70 family RNA polymerase sigma factor [Clostridium perfringens]|uniref:Sigma-70 family RNA polymerase sigma factor n=1 Tax=Clostridium perfringens TaxID=1502 RepID=A0AAP4A976_CLOPF|nr:sigma-70 family RNA polymerase sigma factor [Clostridium perfringens]EGT2192197.1 sigma-70 family RNA polymerase sigma factor [Clostridium perfringens]EHA0993951.1 sigma-70 family RNA polymerase sigma factor [Clostridium perfringens]EHA1184785.1 sigma-70 family RNA polymerase sigma factor [Clostridium perfringens]EJT6143122.1 sigma-70 family RNA polymerase sigma factor [Clostridium perfringens]MDH2337495.1 sigma-70 family RNA polymerase sigma factor [Clostridium perfringens]
MTNEELVVLYQRGDKKALDKLLKNNDGLIYKVASKFYSDKTSSIEFDDLLQEGRIGFILACSKYDIEYIKKTKFITYAFYWIYQKIHRFITTYNTNEEISLNTPLSEENQDELINSIESHSDEIKNREEELYLSELRLELEAVMDKHNTLNEREILKLYYGWDTDELSIEQIADIFETSSSNIKNTKARAIRKLRGSQWFRIQYQRRYSEDITFMRVLRNLDYGIEI